VQVVRRSEEARRIKVSEAAVEDTRSAFKGESSFKYRSWRLGLFTESRGDARE
jgi:hypothetical protein